MSDRPLVNHGGIGSSSVIRVTIDAGDGPLLAAEQLPDRSAPRSPGTADLERRGPWVAGADVRAGLDLTPHQLGELTRRLSLDVGDRPNYPRYGRSEIHLLVSVQALRELSIPVEDACSAVSTHRDQILDGRGWLFLFPDHDRWTVAAALLVEDLASLIALAARAAVVDLDALSRRGGRAWLRLLSRAPA